MLFGLPGLTAGLFGIGLQARSCIFKDAKALHLHLLASPCRVVAETVVRSLPRPISISVLCDDWSVSRTRTRAVSKISRRGVGPST